MERLLVHIARQIYKSTPSPRVRRLYFNAFSHMVRNRRIRETIDGITYDLDLGETIDLGIYLQQFEPDVTAAIKRYCRSGMIVLDIGANVGAHTLPLGKLVGERGRVYAFEPTDYAYRKLAKNVNLNAYPHVYAIKAALSDRENCAQQIAFRSSWRTDGRRVDGMSVVDFLRLDDWCVQNGIDHIDLMKIDVDGNEFGVIKGGETIIVHSRPLILIEAVGPHFEDDETNPFFLLQECGYHFWSARTGQQHRKLSDIKRFFPPKDWAMTRSVNLIASVSAL